MKVIVKLKAIAQQNEIDIQLSDLDLNPDEWKNLSKKAKDEIVNQYVEAEDETNSPYLQAQSYDLEDED